MALKISTELNRLLSQHREEQHNYLYYETEFSFYKAIASGNIEAVKKSLSSYNQCKHQDDNMNGILSKDPVQNEKYHFAIMAALVARFCIEAGLNRDLAYCISDIYIQKVDELRTIEAIEELKMDMVYDFTYVVHDNAMSDIYSIHIIKCIDYIFANLTSKLTVNSIAKYLEMNPTYLSKLFTKETGINLSTYIKQQKLKASTEALIYTNDSISDIADRFGFSSQSHFTNSFQAEYSMTPKKYRNTYASKPMQ